MTGKPERPQKNNNRSPLAPIVVEILFAELNQQAQQDVLQTDCNGKREMRPQKKPGTFAPRNYTLYIYCMYFYKRLYLHLIIYKYDKDYFTGRFG